MQPWDYRLFCVGQRDIAKHGKLLVDFKNGYFMHLVGEAEIIWAGPKIDALPGAKRISRIRPVKEVKLRGDMPIGWQFDEYSPFLDPLETPIDPSSNGAALRSLCRDFPMSY